MADDVRGTLLQFLRDNELPDTLITFITQALGDSKPFAQIMAELRETPEYKAAYPENTVRMANGFEYWPEGQVREYRSEARRLAGEYFGATLSNSEIAGLIGNNKSLVEYEKSLQVYKQVERWGPSVKMVLASELGYQPDDEMIYRFLHGEIRTPELDRAYETALYRGQPAAIGLGVRPEEEAAQLRAFGISPEQAFRGYQGIAGELPRSARLGMIESEIESNSAKFPGGSQLFNDQNFSTIFRAIQLQDPEAMVKLQGTLAREVARFQGQGGAVTDRTGASVGLLSEEERRNRGA